jgi:hypothetical protein
MSYYRAYMQKLVGGTVSKSPLSLKPGTIAIFKYDPINENRSQVDRNKLARITLVLGKKLTKSGYVIHAVNLEHIPWIDFRKFISRIVTYDMILLLKRRYDITAPVVSFIDKPITFYPTFIKKYLSQYNCYRTYSVKRMKQTKVSYLDYTTMFPVSKKDERGTLISEKETINKIKQEKTLINKLVGFDIFSKKEKQFRDMVASRFGSVENFIESAKDISNFVEESSQDGKSKKEFIDNLRQENEVK